MAEPTPPKSPQADEQQSVGSDTAIPTSPADNTQTAPVLPRSTPPEPKCMFVDPCTTGSSLRKAISHIFGRNKLCTKAIPHGIWVHYCRKHYQRSRYRNATDYAIRQVELVLIQIEKVHGWSEENIKTGRRGEGVLKHWTLQARKREAKRLQECDSRKRRFNDEDDEDQEFSSNGTAIPGWLQDKLNKDYGTEEMLAIIKDVKARMDSAEIQQIPDIEILPEIITDGNESRPKATVRRTGSNGSGHRHTKSEVYRAPPSMSSYNGRPGMALGQDNKRFRTGASTYQMPMHNLAHRSLGGMNQGYPYQMGNGFAAIAENQADPNFWNPQSYSSNTVLPAPVPQRHVSVPMAPDNTVQSYAPQSRPMHVRSVSENPVLHNSGHGPTGFRPYTSQPNQGFQQQEMFANYPPPQGYGGPPTYQGQGYDPNMGSNDPNTRFFGQMDGTFDGSADWDSPRNGHARVQSTSSMHPAHMQRHLSMSGGPPSMSSLPSMNGMGNNGMPTYGYGDYQQHQQHRY